MAVALELLAEAVEEVQDGLACLVKKVSQPFEFIMRVRMSEQMREWQRQRVARCTVWSGRGRAGIYTLLVLHGLLVLDSISHWYSNGFLLS